MARLFNATNEIIRLSIGANNYSSPVTYLCICRRASTLIFRTPFSCSLNNGDDLVSISTYEDDNLAWIALYEASIFDLNIPQNTWVLLAAGKNTGSVTPRGHRYVYNTGVWTHSDGDTIVGDIPVPERVNIGAWHVPEWGNWDGDIALCAIFNANLTDAQIERTAFGLPYILSLNPTGLWVLDQGDINQNVIDITGKGANQDFISGTAVSTNHLPIFNRHGEIIYVRSQAAAIAGVQRRLTLLGVGR
jgi:hypothetical protein